MFLGFVDELARVAAAYRWLEFLWRALRDDRSPVQEAFVKGAIQAFLHAGVLTAAQASMWWLRVDVCPGHDDEGGRSWCAYCGEMKKESDESPVKA